jgi:hypothetical protein
MIDKFTFFNNNFFNNNIVEEYNLMKIKDKTKYKIQNIKLYYKKIKLSKQKNTFLLLEDRPFNFLISYGIIIGDCEELYIFKLNQKTEEFIISSKQFIENFEKEIIISSIKKISPKKLYNSKFESYDFENITLKNIKSKSKRNLNIDLNRIQIVKGFVFRNFCPQTSFSDFENLKKIQIEFSNLIDQNNFIKKTNIHLTNMEKLSKKIKPDFELDKNIKVLTNEKEGYEIVNKINKNYFFKISPSLKKRIISLFEKCSYNTFDKNEFYEKIHKINKLKISTKIRNDFFLPFFINKDNDKTYKIKDINDFENLSCVKLKYDYNSFKKLYIKTYNTEEKLILGNEFLRKKFFISFDNLEDKDNNNIKFRSFDDLILSIILFDFFEKSFDKIIDEKNNITITNKNLLSITNSIKKNIFLILKKSIEINEFPKENIQEINKNYINNFFKIKIVELENIQKQFLKSHNIKKFLYLLNKIINESSKIKKNYNIKNTNLFYFLEFNYYLIDSLKNLDIKIYTSFKTFFNEYFRDMKINKGIDFKKEIQKKENDFFINLINLKILSKKYKYIKIKNEKIIPFIDNLNLINFENKSDFQLQKIELKPNHKNIKRLLKYNFENTCLQIKQYSKNKKISISDLKKIDFIKIEINKNKEINKIKLKKDFFYKTFFYSNLKLKYSCEDFDLYTSFK